MRGRRRYGRADRVPAVEDEERWRLFIAAPLAGEAAARLWQQLAALRRHHPAARWTDPEQLHATLIFLGQTLAGEVPRLESVLSATAARWRPFAADVRGSGGRIDGRPAAESGRRRGGVAWLNVGSGRQDLTSLALDLDRALGGGSAEGGPRPHVTVSRRVDQALLDDLATEASRLRLEWTVERIVLYRSHTGPGGSRYEELTSARLGGGA
jgi:RNA 2',3'-cyclic 3'-phosphodiesterase